MFPEKVITTFNFPLHFFYMSKKKMSQNVSSKYTTKSLNLMSKSPEILSVRCSISCVIYFDIFRTVPTGLNICRGYDCYHANTAKPVLRHFSLYNNWASCGQQMNICFLVEMIWTVPFSCISNYTVFYITELHMQKQNWKLGISLLQIDLFARKI